MHWMYVYPVGQSECMNCLVLAMQELEVVVPGAGLGIYCVVGLDQRLFVVRKSDRSFPG